MTIAILTLLALAEPVAQEGSLVDTRFHRVHLKNGNLVDGALVRETRGELVLRLRVGEMAIRRDQIERVEFLKVRSFHEKPREVRPSAVAIAAGRAAPQARLEAAVDVARPASRRTKGRLDELAQQYARASDADRAELFQVLVEAGKADPAGLAELLGRVPEETLDAVTSALVAVKDPASLPVLKSFLEDGKLPVRLRAVKVLGAFGGRSNLAELRSLLGDPEPAVRGAAIAALSKWGDESCFRAAERMCLNSDRGLRKNAVSALFEIAKKHSLEDDLARVLLDAAFRAEGDVRADLVEAFGKTGRKDLWDRVTVYFDDRSPEVRAQAALALGRLGASDSGDAIATRLLLEREYWPRIQLAGAAQTLRLSAAIDPLLPWLDDEDPNIRAAASRALRGITGQNLGLNRAKWTSWRESAKAGR